MIDDEGDKKSSIYPCFTYPSCHRENVGYTQEESNFLSLFVYSLCVGVSIQPDVDVEAKMPNYLCCSTTSTFWIETSVADISFSGWSPSLQSYSHLQEADDFSQTTPLKKTQKNTSALHSSSCPSPIHPTTAESSDYFCRWHDSELCWKSEVYKMNRNGDSTVPCRVHVPHITKSDRAPPSLTHCSLSVG